MRPKVTFLTEVLIKQIISEAVTILCKIGVEIHNPAVLDLLETHGATVDRDTSNVKFTDTLIEESLKSVPSSFNLYDIHGNETHDFSGFNIHFTPGSSALNILDYSTDERRKPDTSDYINYVRLVDQLKNMASQSTAFIPDDVPEQMSDSYRLFLSLLYGRKPVITGAFSIESFNIMKEFQLAIRGTKEMLAEKPLTVFSCCPTSPLKFSHATSQNILDCAKYAIPVEIVTMPLSGFIAPVTLTGTLVQHTAETFSGIVISQMATPGAPILYGGSPAVFDLRYETTPMGAIETMMLDCAYNEIGKYLGIPTQAYISLSDAKQLDAQCGLETGMGATLAALAGINNISGPGMLDFESTISLEKLVLDNEICGMTFRMLEGIKPREDFPSEPIFTELLKDEHLLIANHTRKHLKHEHRFPGPVIDRANHSRWKADGALTLTQRAHAEVENHISEYQPNGLSKEISREMIQLMETEAKRFGLSSLPERVS